jgi:hypothetical protein
MTTQKRQERVERRRSLIELNLIGEKARSGARRKGCLPFATLAIVLAATLAALLGLRLF